MTTDAVSRRYADIKTLVTVQDELRAEAEAMLPDGYVSVGASLRRLREDLPDCITLQGAYGPVEVRGIPYDAPPTRCFHICTRSIPPEVRIENAKIQPTAPGYAGTRPRLLHRPRIHRLGMPLLIGRRRPA